MIIFETISKAKCKHCLLCENNKQVGFTKKDKHTVIINKNIFV